MRAILLVTILLLAAFAGCTARSPAPATLPTVGPVEKVEGAVTQAIAQGTALVWDKVKLPFTAKITLPANATMVRLVADPGSTASVALGMANNETGRRRCNNPTVTDFSNYRPGAKSCSGVAVIDAPGTVWRVAVAGVGTSNVQVQFLNTPLDGIAAGINVAQLSMATYKLQPTTTEFVPSFDGTKLRIEITVPEGPGPWPTILESSPYHDDGVRANPSSFAYFVHDWASRGYAIAVADVRGFGDSGGCVEVWGPNEQQDQAFLVEWAAKQAWSNGHVGFYGQSYVGTTPVEAAVLAPPHLDAIITVAPVVRNYDDWHFGGVPNGENLLSPVGYAVETDAMVGALLGLQIPPLRTEDPTQLANNVGNGPCDPADFARPNDPRALYDAYYIERDFAAKAAKVKAAVLYTHGFEDANVKAQMIPDWFNAIPSPKLGLFGHWLHQHPARMDNELLFLAWMDEHVKGKEMGFASLPQMDVIVDDATHRTGNAWPSPGTTNATFWPANDGTLGVQPKDGSETLALDPAAIAPTLPVTVPLGPTLLEHKGIVVADTALSGNGVLHIQGKLTGAANGYLAAYLYEVSNGKSTLVTWGQFNLAHDATHTTYTPHTPNDVITVDMQLRPTEHIFHAGNGLILELRGVAAADATDAAGAGGAAFEYQLGANGLRLDLPSLPLGHYAPLPLTASP